MVTYVRGAWVETGRLVGLLGACFLSSDLLENHWNEHGRETEETKVTLIGTGEGLLGSQIMAQE